MILIIISAMLFGCSEEPLNSGEKNILYNGIVYERDPELNYNLRLYEDEAWYVGEFSETYGFGQQLPWPVYVLDGKENVLYTSHAKWVKPGYSFPDNFGEEFSSVEYVVSEGIDFRIMEDDYSEVATLLKTFEGGVTLDDIIEPEPSYISGYVEYDEIRFKYKHHPNMAALYVIASLDGKYYLNVCQGVLGTDEWHEIKSEYVDLLTSLIFQ